VRVRAFAFRFGNAIVSSIPRAFSRRKSFPSQKSTGKQSQNSFLTPCQASRVCAEKIGYESRYGRFAAAGKKKRVTGNIPCDRASAEDCGPRMK